jgi:hypothetical protein
MPLLQMPAARSATAGEFGNTRHLSPCLDTETRSAQRHLSLDWAAKVIGELDGHLKPHDRQGNAE